MMTKDELIELTIAELPKFESHDDVELPTPKIKSHLMGWRCIKTNYYKLNVVGVIAYVMDKHNLGNCKWIRSKYTHKGHYGEFLRAYRSPTDGVSVLDGSSVLSLKCGGWYISNANIYTIKQCMDRPENLQRIIKTYV